jgi:hypothetical protein
MSGARRLHLGFRV